MSDDTPEKPKRSISVGSTPMFEAIMGIKAAMLKGKLCRVKNMKACSDNAIEVLKEVQFNGGMDEANLEKAYLEIGSQGMVLGTGTISTNLRFWIYRDDPSVDGTYHVSILNLELVQAEDSTPPNP